MRRAIFAAVIAAGGWNYAKHMPMSAQDMTEIKVKLAEQIESDCPTKSCENTLKQALNRCFGSSPKAGTFGDAHKIAIECYARNGVKELLKQDVCQGRMICNQIIDSHYDRCFSRHVKPEQLYGTYDSYGAGQQAGEKVIECIDSASNHALSRGAAFN